MFRSSRPPESEPSDREPPRRLPTVGSQRPADRGTVARRSVLAATAGAAVAGVGAGLGPPGGSGGHGASGSAHAASRARSHQPSALRRTPSNTGTTLDSVAVPDSSGSGYQQLTEGPGWERLTRAGITDPRSSEGRRAERRTTLASFVQLTDLHLVDVQHPLRYEYLRTETPSAWRPHESLSVAGAAALVERVNALRTGPATGEPLSFAITTGDNTDNNCTAELEWFLTVMSGGRVRPDTGKSGSYEGVQNSGSKLYWHPESALRDRDKEVGFPRIEGMLAAALREVHSPGLRLPWYAATGNHDTLPGGCFGGHREYFADFAVGDRKLMELDDPSQRRRLWDAVDNGNDPKGNGFRELLGSQRRKMRRVTPDPDRAPFTRGEYVRKHLDPRWQGAGPVGHGYSAAQLDGAKLYYSFNVSGSVAGVCLDTTREDGDFRGRIGTAQLRWLEQELARHRKDGRYVLVFSHHTSSTSPQGGDEVVALLQRNPHALAWINGHTHKNTIREQGTFWEISTASHIDFPQLARVVEVTDNQDGTLSLFTTLIESAAPARVDHSDLSQTGLASLYRELAGNTPGRRLDLDGDRNDRNTELLLPKP